MSATASPALHWTLAERTKVMAPSAVREILKISQRADVISFAGGLPSPKTFPVEEFARACAKVLHDQSTAALQYSASEGMPSLRRMVAEALPWDVNPDRVLITTGSQQALDLIAKVFIDPGSRILVETPTYLGALQAFSPMQPVVDGVPAIGEDVDIEALKALRGTGRDAARYFYVLPNFQNPSGGMMSDANRSALADACQALELPIIEDNPYGELWFDQPPPAPISSRVTDGTVYMGSFSKVLAPGLRLGYIVAPDAVFPKLVQAKQAADLHTPSFNQLIVEEVIKDGFLDRHVPGIRALYKAQRDAMLEALREHMPEGVTWNTPNGGMFLWLRMPEGIDTSALFDTAVANGVAFVPGSAFYASRPDVRTMRLSFVTMPADKIRVGIAKLAAVIRQAQ